MRAFRIHHNSLQKFFSYPPPPSLKLIVVLLYHSDMLGAVTFSEKKNNDYYLIRKLVKYDYDIFLEFLSHNLKVALLILGRGVNYQHFYSWILT